MALVKCKECGEQVSTKAKSCPKCGAKVPKSSSIATLFIIIIVILVIYTANQNSNSSSNSSLSNSATSKSSSSLSQKSLNAEKIVPPKPAWTHSYSKDEMTGKFSAYASSPTSIPTRAMNFPYNDVNAWIGVGCDRNNEWVYIGFNRAPNLSNTETEDGYNSFTTRIKWDKELTEVGFTQSWGEKFIHFRDDKGAIAKITTSNSALLELKWHGEQSTYFNFSLNGSSAAIKEIRSKCSLR